MEVIIAMAVMGLGYTFSISKKKEKFTTNYKTNISNNTNIGGSGWDKIINNGDNFTINNEPHQNSQQQNFEHNNMVPFFGAKMTQNTDAYATNRILNNMTGNSTTYRKKQEVGLFFEPTKHVSNVYGFQNADVDFKTRFTPSKIRNNETPIEQIRVGPGLNDGFTNKPSGGFHQGASRDYVMPKNTNQLRTVNNPKVSYNARILSGERINKRGSISKMQKKLPERYYENKPDRYFTTTGSTIAHAQYPKQLIKSTNRKTTSTRTRIAPASSVNGNKKMVYSKVKKPSKTQFKSNGARNASLGDKWSIKNNSSNDRYDDYGKKTIKLNSNARTETCDKTVILNAQSLIGREEARNGQEPRFTRKENFIGNDRSGNIQKPHSKSQYHRPNDRTRTTIRETTSNNDHTGSLNPSNQTRTQYHRPGDKTRTTIRETTSNNDYTGSLNPSNQTRTQYHRPGDKTRTTIRETTSNNDYTGSLNPANQTRTQYHRPGDKTRTTIRETTSNNDHTGSLNPANQTRTQYHRPGDKTRTTIRETTSNNDHTGSLNPANQTRTQYHRPGDKTRTTIRETTSNNNYNGNVGPQKPSRSVDHDPNNIAKTTIKETTIVNDFLGNVNTQNDNTGYKHKHNNLVATTTNRETMLTDYTGNAEINNADGYKIANAKPKDTKRQFLSDNEYTGSAGGGSDNKPMSYSDVYNATIKSLRNDLEEKQSKRMPSQQGNKTLNTNTNYTTSRADSVASSRKMQGNYHNNNAVNNKLEINMFHKKTSSDNNKIRNRVNSEMISALKDNPYHLNLS
jgi:hypothetical protein